MSEIDDLRSRLAAAEAENERLRTDYKQLAGFTNFLYEWLRRICRVPSWYKARGEQIQKQIEAEVGERTVDVELLRAALAPPAKDAPDA